MTEELRIGEEGHLLYGRFHKAEGAGPRPLVILCHGFNANMSETEPYAVKMAEAGIHAFAFDFFGGGEQIRSDGKLTEMSVRTEEADLHMVIDTLMERAEVDRENIFLMGQSQGGYVSLLAASERPGDIKGLILCYPAFNLKDYVLMSWGSHRRVRETYPYLGTRVGKVYIDDAYPIDIQSLMPGYEGRVLILHGTRDELVSYTWSEEAAKLFPSAQLVLLEGAEHGFYGADEEHAAGEMIRFIKANGIRAGKVAL